MRYTKFEFKNFRGITSAKLDLSKSPPGSVHVLVGLNESGKTTVLEAIDHFRTNPDLKRRHPHLRVRSEADLQAMIPINKRASFNGVVSIKGSVQIGIDEVDKIKEAIKSERGYVDLLISKEFSIDHNLRFVNSGLQKTMNNWSIAFQARKRRGATPMKTLSGDDWLNAVQIVDRYIPKVMYFPSHLLEFPDQISLEDAPKKNEVTPSRNSFYYQVLEDVLKAVDPTLSIEAHLLKRIRSGKATDLANAQALIQQVEVHLNRTVLGEWRSIFSSPLDGKQFRLIVRIDEHGACIAEIKLADGVGLFSLNERSAGFRWFFAFIMLVKYRAHRNDNVLFLFDEPAANLHPRAQTELLNSFAALSKQHQFIYTTHSHYLINPLWLESTYIVKNEALDAALNSIDVDPTTTSITITPYRSFVGTHPDQQFYYKPVMDALEYTPSRIAPDKASVLVEGKTDFYCLEYFRAVYFPDRYSLALFPGGGSGSLDTIILLLSGWAVQFAILLDSDAAGAKEGERYRSRFESLVDGRVTSLGSLLTREGRVRVEELFAADDKEIIRATLFSDQPSLTKKHLHRAIQELLASQRKLTLSEETLDNFERVLSQLQAMYDGLTSNPAKHASENGRNVAD